VQREPAEKARRVRIRLQDIALSAHGLRLAVDFESEAASVGLFGPTGAGKTTLLEIIAGLRRPDRGRVLIGDRDLTDLPARLRRIGYVPQDETLFPHLNVRSNVQYGAASGDGRRVKEIAALLDVEKLLDRRVAGLSGGERRLVAMARALASEPTLLLLDEPLTGLDAPLRARIVERLEETRRITGVPMIFVSHDRDDVIRLCDQVLMLERGAVVRPGAVQDLR
jgi:molybdate transport system ATP-binding protein